MRTTSFFWLWVMLFPTICFAQTKKTKQAKSDYLITIHTSYGLIRLILFEDTPKHKENFLKLAQSKFYDSTTFHRVIDQFMIQGGDPNSKDKNRDNDGTGGPGYTIPAEFRKEHTHTQGALAAARMGDGVNPAKESSGSQFYIVQNAQGTHFLDNSYTVFGQTIAGLDVVDKIAKVAKDGRDMPVNPVKMAIETKKMKKKKISKLYGYTYPAL